MAFGRSNSLSINTGTTNSLFGQLSQNQNQNQSNAGQPSQAGSLFGRTAAQNTSSQPSGGAFGGANSNTQGSGLFGNTQSGGLFGNTQSSQAPGAGSLFGTTTQNQATTQTSSLFGGGGQAPQQQNSLFGNTQPTQQQTQPSLFGNSAGTSLFGQNQQQNQINNNNNNNNNSQSLAGSIFSNSQQPFNTQPSANSILGLNAVPREQLNDVSLLNVSRFNNPVGGPLHGRLSMGQGSAPNNNASAGAVRVNFEEMRSTTRFQDLIDPVKSEFERADAMIQMQERFCREIEAFTVKHKLNVLSVAPDVEYVREKADAVDQVLSSDARAVQARRTMSDKDRRDFDRCQRVAENLKLPQPWHSANATAAPTGLVAGSAAGTTTNMQGQVIPQGIYGQQRLAHPAGSPQAKEDGETRDTDLIGNFFLPLAAELRQTAEAYSSNLAEIEQHMSVIESSAIAQAQRLAAKRAGVRGGGAGAVTEDETVRDLADTLRGFEQSILGVAGTVGRCREGTTELAMGRLGESLNNGRGERGWN